ncbi:Lcl C-terminal domain-containing protein [Hydrogenimonas cancrithermarum]|uniref:Lcl C-terminal domain-containing protein n=1 Tax=Hydrogenimonas cancrithermarum TaxID=2993563 RepID=A0ABN6WSB2_9BACT|nr:DUF1566 domain-containing protein [Hydrogenimonas cancrithermarum]BDY12035.1 hypothetical protein HCR_03470 [Hydrogenimonas cancrithermarum]
MRSVLITMVSALLLFAGEFREVDGTYDYFQARNVCGQKLGNGWRVPEIWELFPLRGETEKFGKDKRYWSGNTLGEARIVKMIRHENEYFVNNKDIPAFAFYLQDGDITPTPKWVKAHLICTNQAKVMQSDEGFEKLPDGRVVDRRNGIIWESIEKKTRRNLKLPFEGAQAYCEERKMRLPTLDELYAIVNYNYVKPAVNKSIFGPMHLKYYWSDDEFGDNEAYVVGFSVGSVATSEQEHRSYFRCVEDME